MLSSKRQQNVIELCQKLIQTPSVTGKEEAIAKLVQKEMLALGFDEAWIDDLGNVIGKVKGIGQGPKILFDGHLDTVEVSDPTAWSKNPYGAEIVDGRIFGRGAADMKGALAGMISGIGFLAQDERPKGDIYVSGTVLEEVAEGFSLSHILRKVEPNIVVIGEASELNLNIGQRGRAEIVLQTKGIPVHSSNPEIGVNAVDNMRKLLDRMKEISLPKHHFLGSSIMELTDIISWPYPGTSVVPEKCIVTFDRRLMIEESQEQVIYDIKKIIEEMSQEDEKFYAIVDIAELNIETYTGFKVKHYQFAPAWLLNIENDVVKKAVVALKAIGMNANISAYSFCTNGSASAGIHKIPTIGFGPCMESQAHVIDEYIEINHLLKATEGYYQLGKYLSDK